jgi:predicted MPP superfamily phosphohydrolase
MSAQFLIFFGIAFVVYSTASYYVGLRGWQAFHALPAFPGGPFYVFLFAMISFSYVLERIFGSHLPNFLGSALATAGSYWLAVLYYLLLFCLVIDSVRLLNLFWTFLPRGGNLPALAGAVVVLLVFLLVGFGTWNARTTVWKHYDLSVNKSAGELQELRIILVTDIHLGRTIDSRRLEELVEAINGRRPDIVLLAGDVIDEDIGHFVDQRMAATFRKLTPRFGVFSAMGNHEYISGEPDKVIELMRSGGVTVLRDSFVTVGDRFIVAGRDDYDRGRFGWGPRKPLDEVLRGINPERPLLLMDHQPRQLGEASALGVDLSVSGHTHHGQLFPNQWITQAMYELDWGYLLKGSMHAVVSAGFGTWGPPVRTSAPSEIVEIRLVFRP